MQERHPERERRQQQQGRPRPQGSHEPKPDEEGGMGRGEEYGDHGERQRAQGDVYGQEQQRSAGPRGEREREDPPHGWYGRQRPPKPENFPSGGTSPPTGQSQRGEAYQGSEGGYEQGHRGGYQQGYRGSQSGYEQDYEQFRGREGQGAQTYGGPGYQEPGRVGRGEGGGQAAGRGGGLGAGHRGRGPKNYIRSDERICNDVNDRLMESDDVDPSEVEVHVEHGEVILRGTAHSKQEKRRMEDIAGTVLGVEEVLNHLRIRRWDERGREEWSRRTEPGQP